MVHQDGHFVKPALTLDGKLKLSNFGNWHFLASFGQVYLKNRKRQEICRHTSESSQHNNPFNNKKTSKLDEK
jgi:hypothetical protein